MAMDLFDFYSVTVAMQQDGAADAPVLGAEGGLEGADGSAETAENTGGGGGGGFTLLMPLLIGLFAFMLISTMFGQRKDKKKREEMLSTIGKQDKVQTIGGVIGTIVELKDAEMVLQVDDASKTRIRFARSAIQQVLKSNTREVGDAQPAEPVVGQPA